MISNLKIFNCYDSHTHFLATGQTRLGLDLRNLKSPVDIKNIIPKPEFYRAEWLIGFGWDQNKWSISEFPDKKTLDQYYPDTPVFFSRVDGHSSWLNTKAIEILSNNGYQFRNDPLGGKICRDNNGDPTGILQDQAHINALFMLPDYSEDQIEVFILESMRVFNSQGFTHVRDLSMNLSTARVLNQLNNCGKQTVCIEGFVTAESISDFDRAYAEFRDCQNLENQFVRMQGLKIFVDGSLGSKTAALSMSYLNENNFGILSWSSGDIIEAIKFCWSKNISIAVHTIGDEAVHQVALAAREVSASGYEGKIHLEHIQLMRKETLPLLKSLHITCHMQPCHWLSDHSWLASVIDSSLIKNLFQWNLVTKNKIPLYFGSDSPIELTSLQNNKKAIEESALYNIAKPVNDWFVYHTHPDKNWGNAHTEFDSQGNMSVYFNGKKLFN